MSLHLVPEPFARPLAGPPVCGAAPDIDRAIANSLSVVASLVHVQAQSIRTLPRALDGRQACDMIEQIGTRIDAVARLHRMLARQDDGAVDLADYLREICESAVACDSRRADMALRFAALPGCRVRPDRALSIGFIVGELVTNAVRHAHPTGIPGLVHVECASGPEGTRLVTVSDDGVGLPEGFDPRRSRQLGMRIVCALADQLTARLAFDSGKLGLSVRLRIPVEGSPRACPPRAAG